MSIPIKETIKCSKCSKEYEVDFYESVDTNIPNLTEKIIDGTFFQAVCPHCKNVDNLEYDVLYNDLRRDIMIFVDHNITDETENAIKRIIKNENKLPINRHSIVSDMNRLREKVSIIYNNRDDRFVEIMKKIYSFRVEDQVPLFKVSRAYYLIDDGEEIFLFYDAKDEAIKCDFDEKTYKQIEYDNWETVRLLSKDKLIIDDHWATKYLWLKYNIEH